MNTPEHQCQYCKAVWTGDEIECPNGCEATLPYRLDTPEDNPYIVSLTPAAFGLLYEWAEEAVGWHKEPLNPDALALWRAVQEADWTHVCVDEQDTP